MQFNVRNGPPSTWQTCRADGDADGATDPYDPADGIASAARYLHALLDGAHGDVAAAVFGYNHSPAYVADVLARARAYSSDPAEAFTAAASAGCAPGSGVPARDRDLVPRVRRLSQPWFATHVQRRMLGARARLVGVAVLRNQRALPAVRLRHGVQGGRRCRRTLVRTVWATWQPEPAGFVAAQSGALGPSELLSVAGCLRSDLARLDRPALSRQRGRRSGGVGVQRGAQ
jgi:hypothetical protein